MGDAKVLSSEKKGIYLDLSKKTEDHTE